MIGRRRFPDSHSDTVDLCTFKALANVDWLSPVAFLNCRRVFILHPSFASCKPNLIIKLCLRFVNTVCDILQT
jgi:hypothetical protein